MRTILISLIIISLSCLTFGQKAKEQATEQNSQDFQSPDRSNVELPLANRAFRPKVSLQEALKQAEGYIEREKIDISRYYLFEVRMIQYGGEKDVKEPRWLLWWVHENGALGNYVQISVSMDGRVERHSSM